MTPETSLPQLLHKRLRAQADLFYALTAHPTLIGSGREDALAGYSITRVLSTTVTTDWCQVNTGCAATHAFADN